MCGNVEVMHAQYLGGRDRRMGLVPATLVFETTKIRGATPCGIRESDGRLSSLHQTLIHFYVMSAADSAHHGSACVATTEHMSTPTLTEVDIRRTDGSLHTHYTTQLIVSNKSTTVGPTQVCELFHRVI